MPTSVQGAASFSSPNSRRNLSLISLFPTSAAKARSLLASSQAKTVAKPLQKHAGPPVILRAMAPTVHNHKARRDYFINETYEAGIELKGTKVKSLRDARASIDDAFGLVERRQVWLYNAHITAYEFGNRCNVDPPRPHRLLLHKKGNPSSRGECANSPEGIDR